MSDKMKAKKPGVAIKDTAGDKVFHIITYILLGVLALIILYPVYFIVIASFSDPDAVLAGKVVLFPVGVNFEGYAKILERTDVSKLDVDFLKVPHHGYNTSSSVDFIEAVSPEISMTTGRLPIPAKVRDRYEALGSVFLDDRTNGYVEVTGSADGELKYTASRNDAVEEAPDTGEDLVPDESED